MRLFFLNSVLLVWGSRGTTIEPAVFEDNPGQPTLWPMDDEPSTTAAARFRMYKYSASQLAAMGEKLALKAQQQRESDHILGPRFAPLLEANYEELLTTTDAVGFAVLGERIAATATATIFGLKGNPNLVIKYQVDMEVKSVLHPLLRDAWFMEALQQTNVVPKVLYISPPTGFVGTSCLKTGFTMSRPQREFCVSRNRMVRFMIMERLTGDMHAFVRSNGANAYRAIHVMIELITGLSRIHSLGIVHGDIHPGNVGFRTLAAGGSELFFIDFGLSFHVDEKIATPDKESERLSYVHCLYSHWDLEGYRFSFRDDVFKAIMIGAYLIHGQPWLDQCTSLEADGEEMLRYKSEGFLFDYPGVTQGVVDRLGLHYMQKPVVKRLFENVLTSIRSVHNINEKPDYDSLVKTLSNIKEIVDKRRERFL